MLSPFDTIRVSIVALTLGAYPASAAFFDGNDLYDRCLSSNDQARSYIVGAADAIELFSSTKQEDGTPIMKRFICIPNGARTSQVADAICSDLRKHPEMRNLSASVLINNTLIKTWPCR